MPTEQDWKRQQSELLALGLDVHDGADVGSVLFTLTDALIASITHLQRHDGAIEALADDLRDRRGSAPAIERPLTLEEILPRSGSDATDAPSPS